jgi:hypothetical protein
MAMTLTLRSPYAGTEYLIIHKFEQLPDSFTIFNFLVCKQSFKCLSGDVTFYGSSSPYSTHSVFNGSVFFFIKLPRWILTEESRELPS